jgi:hypothetical protein
MKKLFIISEDERKRILSLHENASKRQYLGEAKITGDQYIGRKVELDKENQITKNIYQLLFTSGGGMLPDVDETKLVNELLKIKDVNTFKQVNNELTQIFKLLNTQYKNLDYVLNDVLDYNLGDKSDVERLISHLNTLGVSKEITKNLRSANFDSSKIQGETAANPDQTKKTPEEISKNFNYIFTTKYPCVMGGKEIKYTSGNGGFYYKIGDIVYYVNGGYKNTITGAKGTFKCNGKQISLDGETAANPDVTPKPRVVPETSEDLLQGKGYLTLNDSNSLVKQVQNNLISADEFVTPTGTFDKETYDAVKSFQSKNRLKSDGIVGKKTWSILSNVKPETIAPKEIDRIS